jgi:hypothetical protein
MLRSRFAGIPVSSSIIRRSGIASVDDSRERTQRRCHQLRWPASFRKCDRFQIGTSAGVKSQSLTGLPRNSHSGSIPDRCGRYGQSPRWVTLTLPAGATSGNKNDRLIAAIRRAIERVDNL